MPEEEWREWLANITGHDSARAIARRINRSHTTVLRWTHGPGSPEAVIEIAIGYNADVVSALASTGWIRAEDMGRVNLDDTIKRLETVKLTAELHRRAVIEYRGGRASFAQRP